jgi:hypothetical protein
MSYYAAEQMTVLNSCGNTARPKVVYRTHDKMRASQNELNTTTCAEQQ